jgi:hypothetical protein
VPVRQLLNILQAFHNQQSPESWVGGWGGEGGDDRLI